LAIVSWRFITLRIIAGTLGSMLWHWSSMYTTSFAQRWATGSVSSRIALTSSWAIRKSWYGSIEPTIRSSSPYFLSLRSKLPRRPSARSRATICSMLTPIAWWPVSTHTVAWSPTVRQTESAWPQSCTSVE
jgi:hypothetical protein